MEAKGERMKVLIVDDDRLGLKTVGFMVRKLGYEVYTAENGAQALEMWREHEPKVVLSDWNMPEMDGLDLVKTIREEERDRHRYTYFILISERGEKADILTGLEAGADDYLAKPVDKDELILRLRTSQRIVEMEQYLVDAKRAAESASEAKSAFLAKMSHETAHPFKCDSGFCPGFG